MLRRPSMEEKNERETEVLDFNKPDFSFIPKGVHEWRQQGYYLVCKSCDLEHAVWIGNNRILIGINDKGPILERR
jgi:hypothetical protein